MLMTRAAPRKAGGGEFIVLVALTMALAALSIDLLLPAFPEMRAAFDLPPGDTSISAVITTFFLGLAAGQLVFGPLSDRFGRKPMLYAGFALFLAGGIGAAAAGSLGGLVVWRFLWGFGAAAPRALSVAIVRDSYEGERMARVMSLVMAVFVLVPVFAPTVGSVLVDVGGWRAVAVAPIAMGLVVAGWSLRLPETIHPEDRRPVSPRSLATAARTVVSKPPVLCYLLATMFLFGILTGFIGNAEVLIDQVFDAGDAFPIVFAAIVVSLAFGSLVSARVVMRLGLAKLLRRMSVALVVATGVHAALAVATGGEPPLLLWIAAMAAILPVMAMTLPNVNTAAMTPLGHVAGMGAAVLGSVGTAGGALLGSLADGAFDGTVRPFALLLFAYGVAGAVMVLVALRLSDRAQPVEAGEIAGHAEGDEPGERRDPDPGSQLAHRS